MCTVDAHDEIVNTHNEFRRNVRPPAQDMLQMSWSDDIAETVQSWVDGCVLRHAEPLERTLDGYELGENLFYSNNQADWASVVSAWHDEVHNFRYPDKSKNGKPIGHYTQVIWNTSYKVGCAMTLCPKFYYYGCRYSRGGNVISLPPYKAGKSCGMCPDHCVDKLCTNPCPYLNTYPHCYHLTVADCNRRITKLCPALCKCHNKIIAMVK
ncbi:cysteine-rich venom protein pseudecin [Eucyclogobius newberryi]|uniref:cysteine-rich venom protein pseudecin n=1 Tax=Eucyclogobius newberryi TaxID=166745 RepID=UPI003B5B1733